MEQTASVAGTKSFKVAAKTSEEHQGATCTSAASCRLGAPLQELLAQSLVLSVVRNALQTAVKFKVSSTRQSEQENEFHFNSEASLYTYNSAGGREGGS